MILFKSKQRLDPPGQSVYRWVLEVDLFSVRFSSQCFYQDRWLDYNDGFGIWVNRHLSLGSQHIYYDGPHCSFSLGFIHFSWYNPNCRKCLL